MEVKRKKMYAVFGSNKENARGHHHIFRETAPAVYFTFEPNFNNFELVHMHLANLLKIHKYVQLLAMWGKKLSIVYLFKRKALLPQHQPVPHQRRGVLMWAINFVS